MNHDSLFDSAAWSAEELARAQALATRLRRRFGDRTPLIAVRAPGRANLIGEHTDYSGLPVLPVAIDRATIIVAAAQGGRSIELYNENPLFPSRGYAIEKTIAPYPRGDWGNYHKAAVQAVIDKFPERFEDLCGITAIIDSQVPPAAGLSSSAALAVASALSFMAINNLQLAPLELASMVAAGERYVGTLAGGMDQAVSVMAQRDHAVFIEFNPLRARPVPIPPHAALIVADTLDAADKSGTVRNEYNRRVIECSLAARLLAKALNLRTGPKILGDVLSQLRHWCSAELLKKLAESAPPALGTLAEAASLLQMPEQSLRTVLLGHGPSIALDEQRPLVIYPRARHVLSETERVNQAVAALEAGDIGRLGRLLDQSHQSLKQDFDVSTPALNRLARCAREAGAAGARLTGAGFGGAIIALCRIEQAQEVLAALDRGYYAERRKTAGLDQVRTVVRAGAGTSAIRL